MTGRKTRTSRIKGLPDRLISTNKDLTVTVFLATALMQGKCKICKKLIYVSSNEGLMCCPHCLAHGNQIDWLWGKIKTMFVPEEPQSR